MQLSSLCLALTAVAVKKLLKCFIYFGAAFFRRVTLLGEEVAIMMGFVGAVSVTRHAFDFTKRRICVRRARAEFGRRLYWRFRNLRNRNTHVF